MVKKQKNEKQRQEKAKQPAGAGDALRYEEGNGLSQQGSGQTGNRITAICERDTGSSPRTRVKMAGLGWCE